MIVGFDAPILVTGANGFIGSQVVEVLLRRGFRNIRCLVRSANKRNERLLSAASQFPQARLEFVQGNLKSPRDCDSAAKDVRVAFHLAAGVAEKSFPGCFLNTVVTTRNLLESLRRNRVLDRFVNVSSFAVYSNVKLKRHTLLDETCELENHHVARNEAYAFAKRKQEEIVIEYGTKYQLPYVILRPGAVYGPGKSDITGRVGIGTFGLFLHLGGSNQIPFTYVTNCADAIVLAGITEDVESHVFNVVDDDLPASRAFIRQYAAGVDGFRYLSVPYPLFYLFCSLWEKYSDWSKGQLPPAFNRRKCSAYWKGNRYTNEKLKTLLGWEPRVSYQEGLRAYLDYIKEKRAASC
jgi:nucleoside-diphosphate-sugar epimerase